jgi:hypothetical protein
MPDLHSFLALRFMYLAFGIISFFAAVSGVSTGKVSGRFVWVYRAKDPKTFWALVATFRLVLSLLDSPFGRLARTQSEAIHDKALTGRHVGRGATVSACRRRIRAAFRRMVDAKSDASTNPGCPGILERARPARVQGE